VKNVTPLDRNDEYSLTVATRAVRPWCRGVTLLGEDGLPSAAAAARNS
jgi:hypothetical protein